MGETRLRFLTCLEIGCNWGLFPQNSKFNLMYAEEMIREAGLLGVQAIKLQYYSTDEIIAYEEAHPPTKYTQAIYKYIRKTELNIDNIKHLQGICKDNGVEMMVTPFINPEKVKELDPYVHRWKIRERDSGNRELIQACLKTGKPVYVSKTTFNHEESVEYSDNYRQIFCIPSYPASYEQLMALMPDLDLIRMWWGYSNHIPDPSATLLLASRAINSWHPEFYIEMHYKLKGTEPVDNAVSMDFDQVKNIMAAITSWQKITPKQDTLFEYV